MADVHVPAEPRRRDQSQIYQSEVDGGDLPVDAVLEVETKNRSYRLKSRGDGRVLISGQPRHCPEPVLARIHGSTLGQSMLKAPFIGRGMYLEYWHPTRGVIRTSRIREIRELPAAARQSIPSRTPAEDCANS